MLLSLLESTSLPAATGKPPKRLIFLNFGFGPSEAWYPSDGGADFALTEAMNPLADLRDSFSVISNLTNLQASGTNTFVVWTNSPANDTELRLYTAGTDYDEDGDGLSSAREILTYKSKVDDVDSDDDAYVDGPSGVVSTNVPLSSTS